MVEFDWNQMWKERKGFSDKGTDKDFWDRKAPKFRRFFEDGDPYAERFIEYMDIAEGKTVFDMGCGPGVLAIPLAKKGHEVWATDFSEPMLKVLMDGAKDEGVEELIHPIKLDWNEDWKQRELPVCDFAISSRSMILEDLTDSIKKLESVAAERCCLGVWDDPAMGYDRYVAKAIGFERPGYGCHYIVLNELMERDLYPELKYIYTPFRKDKYNSYDEGVRILHDSFGGKLTAEQENLFNEYCRFHLKEVSKDGERFWQMNHGSMSSIAFIRWDRKTVFEQENL